MTDIYLNQNHDLELLNGDLRITASDYEDIKQRLSIALQFFLGEWFLDTTKGVPYTQTIYEAGFNDLPTLYSIFRTEIQNTEGVDTIESLELDLDGDERILTVRTTVNGIVTTEVSL